MTELARGFADALDLMEPRGDFSTLPLGSRSPLLQVEGGSTVKTNAEEMRNYRERALNCQSQPFLLLCTFAVLPYLISSIFRRGRRP